MNRRASRAVQVGNVMIGGSAPITVQSMLNKRPDDLEGNLSQARALAAAGCEIIRVAIQDEYAVALIPELKKAVSVPIVADIHFDYRLAIAAVETGVDKVRINPGNIGDDARVKAVADCCKQHEIPIRIGVNSGSLNKQQLEKYGGPTAEALVESALENIAQLERYDFGNILVAIKSSNVKTMIEANTSIAAQCDYPLHLGVTETGTERMGTVKSSVGIGSLLDRGIGDTIRVSLSADPVKEVAVARDILQALNLRDGPRLVACPTCGRTRIDLISLAEQVEQRMAAMTKPITVAVMGCVVNGPGEAREADIGVAGAEDGGVIFKKGKPLRRVKEDCLLDELMKEIELI